MAGGEACIPVDVEPKHQETSVGATSIFEAILSPHTPSIGRFPYPMNYEDVC